MNCKEIIMQYRWKKRGVKLTRGSAIDAPTQIGEGTRINGPIHIKGKGECFIGKHCALGSDIKIITSNHGVNYANLQCHLQRKIGAPEIDTAKGAVTVGHNVWIGDSVIILAGVTIGDGAVIGAGAVVTRDVPCYSVAVGVPSKPVRMRFAPSICDQLKQHSWWHWGHARIVRNRRFFEVDLANASVDICLADLIVD